MICHNDSSKSVIYPKFYFFRPQTCDCIGNYKEKIFCSKIVGFIKVNLQLIDSFVYCSREFINFGLVLLFVQTIHTSRTRKRIVPRMVTTGKMWKSDDFRKFMKVRLHNSFPHCDALCSRDVVTWNLRPLPLFSREQQRISLFRCAFYGFALYNVFQKSCIDNGEFFYIRKCRFQKVFLSFGENTIFNVPKDLYIEYRSNCLV